MMFMGHTAFQLLLAFYLQSPCAWCSSMGKSVHKGCRAVGRPSNSLYNDPRLSCMACSSQERAAYMVPGTCFAIHGSGQRTLTKSSYSYLLRAMLQSSPPSSAEKLPGLCGRLSKPIFQPLPSDNWKSCGAAAVCVSVLGGVLPDRLPVFCIHSVKSDSC